MDLALCPFGSALCWRLNEDDLVVLLWSDGVNLLFYSLIDMLFGGLVDVEASGDLGLTLSHDVLDLDTALSGTTEVNELALALNNFSA